mgnify:FL=1
MDDRQKLQIEARGKILKAIVVTIIALVWLVFIDPTDVFPVVGWIDDGGLLYCAYRCIVAAKQHSALIKATYSQVESNVDKVAKEFKTIKEQVTTNESSVVKENNLPKLDSLDSF